MTLATPVLADAQGLVFQISDPSFFIAFEPEQKDPVKLAGAPEGCVAKLIDPQSDKNQEDLKKLGEAFFQQLGGNSTVGLGVAKSIAVSCAKS